MAEAWRRRGGGGAYVEEGREARAEGLHMVSRAVAVAAVGERRVVERARERRRRRRRDLRSARKGAVRYVELHHKEPTERVDRARERSSSSISISLGERETKVRDSNGRQGRGRGRRGTKDERTGQWWCAVGWACCACARGRERNRMSAAEPQQRGLEPKRTSSFPIRAGIPPTRSASRPSGAPTKAIIRSHSLFSSLFDSASVRSRSHHSRVAYDTRTRTAAKAPQNTVIARERERERERRRAHSSRPCRALCVGKHHQPGQHWPLSHLQPSAHASAQPAPLAPLSSP